MKKMLASLFSCVVIALATVSCSNSQSKLETPQQTPQLLAPAAGQLSNIVHYSLDPLEGVNSSSKKNYPVDSAIVRAEALKKGLLYELGLEHLQDKNKVEEIPAFVMAFLDSMAGKEKFGIVNPGEKYQEDWLTLGQDLPSRQLVYFGVGTKTALISYNSGGHRKMQHAGVLKFSNNKVIAYWFEPVLDQPKTPRDIIDYLKRIGPKHQGQGC